MEKSKEVLNYEGVKLYRSDISMLKAPCPLSERILEFFFTYLSRTYSEAEDLALISPHVSSFIAVLPDETEEFLRPFNLHDKNLIIFAVIDLDSEERGSGGCIYHFSLLVYSRKLNAFVHHDSVEGVNTWCAKRLFNAVKAFVVDGSMEGNSKRVAAINKKSSRTSRKGKKESKRSNSISVAMKKKKNDSSKSNSADLPTRLIQGYTPQQINQCDCGLYVMSIARAICAWHLNDSKKKCEDWFSAVGESVNLSVESTLRGELLQLVGDLAIRKS